MFWNSGRTSGTGSWRTTVWRPSAFANVCRSERLLSTFSRLCLNRTGRGGGPQVHWNVNFGLKRILLKSGADTAQKIHCLPFLDWSFCSCLHSLVERSANVHVFINCGLSVPHPSRTCYLNSGIVIARRVGVHSSQPPLSLSPDERSDCHLLHLGYVCTTRHFSTLLFSWLLFIVGTHKSFV